MERRPGLVGDVGAEVPAHDAVPRGVVLLVKLLLDVRGNVLLYVILLQGLNKKEKLNKAHQRHVRN